MFQRTIKGEFKKIARYTVLFFLILSMGYLTIAVIVKTNENRIQRENVLNVQRELADVEREIISNKINRLVSDVLYMADSFQLNSTGEDGYANLKRQWLVFSERKKIYDQIRFIDMNGDERVRVNYSDTGAQIVGDAELQSKKDRYYFGDTITLQKNQVCISPLDLNVENGEVEQPEKPMIRLSTPCYDSNGQQQGIVVLNYSAQDMLQQVKNIASTGIGAVYMLNADGYWLYNSADSSTEWSFMYKDRTQHSFAATYPTVWQQILPSNNGVWVSDQGVFNYTNVLANQAFVLESGEGGIHMAGGDWYIVSYIAPQSKVGRLFTGGMATLVLETMQENPFVYLMILAVAFLLASFVFFNKLERDRIRYFSEYDVMTGVYNRRAGFAKLDQLYKAGSRHECHISICFIDINGLKEVNDFLGHEAGDELILTVAEGIRQHIRKTDFVSRLGGDEFLIVFETALKEQAEAIWQNIVQYYEKINEHENRKYLVSVSHGIETFHCDTNEYIDSVINHADEKMYNEKREIKKNLRVIRDLQGDAVSLQTLADYM
ncbi:MAG: diguanylate cyclase [Pygmaiobacter sp.]|nr:diguanylate cyclase [Pygmaiobacter sp.]